MTSEKPRYIRRYIITVIVLVLVAPFLIYGAHQSVESMSIAPEKWAPPYMQSRKNYDRFMKDFESNDLILISWPGCTVDDPRLTEFEKRIEGPGKTDFGETHEEIFDRIVTGAGTVDSLTAPPLKLPRDEALERLQGVLVGKNLKDSCAVIILTYRGNELRTQAIDHVLKVAQDVCGLPREGRLRLGAPCPGIPLVRRATGRNKGPWRGTKLRDSGRRAA